MTLKRKLMLIGSCLTIAMTTTQIGGDSEMSTRNLLRSITPRCHECKGLCNDKCCPSEIDRSEYKEVESMSECQKHDDTYRYTIRATDWISK